MYFDKPYNRSEFIRLIESKIFPTFQRIERPLEFWKSTAYFVDKWITQLWIVELDQKIYILEIEQKSSNDPRVTLTKDAFKILEYHWIDHAVVIFHCKDTDSYRLSLLTVTYENWEKKTSPYKRYSYILWPSEKVKTPELELLHTIKNYEDLTNRFKVEVVRNQFFDEYLELFVRLYKEIQKDKPFVELLESQNKDIVSFTKNLLWKIIFLYFVQKKWWLWLWKDTKYWEWKKDFMRILWDDFKNNWERISTEKTWYFYNDYLEWLFFAWLNIDRRQYDDWFPSLKMKVPYLNWWLFKEEYSWRESYVTKISNDIFSNERIKWIWNGDWILDIFDRYNFTIDEDSLYDRDIAVDPEMLGRIFEKMISINSDNIWKVLELYNKKNTNAKFDFWKELNKKLWAFYTPREIVHYMTKESLINYLINSLNIENWENIIRQLFELKEKFLLNSEDMKNESFSHEVLKQIWDNIVKIDWYLKAIKILDPAIWSWAFPMWLLHEISSLRYYIYWVFHSIFENKINWYKDEKWKISLYKIKREIILNNIYWIDIDQGAIDIAKLRFRLSLVVDEDEPEPLPNFEFKFICATSTVYLEKWSLFTKEETIKKLMKLREDYYECDDESIKKELRKQFSTLKSELTWFWKNKSEFKSKKEREDYCYNLNMDKRNRQILERDPFESKTYNPWFDSEIMFWTKYFDIVIWNPPYIKEDFNRSAFDWFREQSPYYMWKMDLWYWFACYWIDLLFEKWTLCFIAQNNWTTSAWAKIMRNKVIKETTIKEIIDFNTYMVFENASIQTMIMMFEKNNNLDNYKFEHRILLSWSKRNDMISLLNKVKNDYTKFWNPTISRKKYINSLLTFSENWNILEKIESNKLYLDDKEIAQWIVPNPDVVNSRNIKNLTDKTIEIWEWVFVINKDKFNNLSEAEKKYIKPLYEPYLMQPYSIQKNDKCLIYITKSNWWNDAPTLLNHLKKYKEIMELRRENQNWRIDFMHLHRPREEKFFIKWPKILSVRKCVNRPIFTYYEKEAYVMMSINVILTDRRNMKFLTWILNSKLIAFWLKNKWKMQWDNYQIDKEPLLGIPLPNTTWDNSIIVKFVEKILSIKSENNDSDTSDIEKEIDKEVYKLYWINNDDIKIIEASIK